MYKSLLLLAVSGLLNAHDQISQLNSIYRMLEKSCDFFSATAPINEKKRSYIDRAIHAAENFLDELQDAAPAFKRDHAGAIRSMQARYAQLKSLVDIELDRSVDSPKLLVDNPFISSK